MDFLDALNISASGLNAQRVRMNVISSNLANVNTTRTPEGGPYQRKEVIFASQSGSPSFSEVLDAQRLQGVSEVKVEKVVNDSRPLLQKYDPHHPDADAQGYVTMPNINVIEEMVNMISATRSYDANVAAAKAAKNMALKALEIGR